ncbi:MAG: NADH:ubiquinone reductase (Na(+)-transporting) subunit D [Candidatus Cloacimonetes bacterium HGW-Cloacimonetes-2]|jgi:Na+-transporting NADH:ubiquinone oxidoreductase subunit D|nr:MAG: NADH:ubiquinone reductase (Na(+)-transporting) subunit D [Candidatus Cloacimonetes bacterium HGW-Cloacimonetes-2]
MNKKEIFINAAFRENSVWKQILGICSSLAVTNLLMNSLIMGLGVTFSLALSNFTISALRAHTPRSVRMMMQTLIIAAYVIVVDVYLKANMPVISKQLGPYVGLIITNCILMGRAEAFAAQNKPVDSLIDGIGSGLGYTLVLLAIAAIREFFGFGSLFGFPIMGDWWVRWSIMVMAPSAFFLLAILIWIINSRYYKLKA